MKSVKVFEVGAGAAKEVDQTLAGKGQALENRIKRWVDGQGVVIDVLQVAIATGPDGSIYAALIVEGK